MRRHAPRTTDASTDEASAPRQLDLDALLIPFQRQAPAIEAYTVHATAAANAATSTPSS